VLLRDGEEVSKRRPGAKKIHIVFRMLDPGVAYTVSVWAKDVNGLGIQRTAQIALPNSSRTVTPKSPMQSSIAT
jgi:hypothetical protein